MKVLLAGTCSWVRVERCELVLDTALQWPRSVDKRFARKGLVAVEVRNTRLRVRVGVRLEIMAGGRGVPNRRGRQG